MGCGCKGGVSSSKNVVKKTTPTPRRSKSSSGRIIKRIIK